MIEADKLLYNFRKNANIEPNPGAPGYVGSWESWECHIRGHFTGHYLSALSLAWANTGNPRFLERLAFMVQGLAQVQGRLQGRYLSAFARQHFQWLEDHQEIWAPYYVIHKLMAGLLDAYQLGGISQALNMTRDMAAFHYDRTAKVIQAKGMAHWNMTLNVEFGGMNEVLYRLYRLTGDPLHKRFAELFHKQSFYEPLAANVNKLKDLHSNTHLAQVVGFAAEHETTGSAKARTAVENFFRMVTQHHAYASGGTSGGEHWAAPDRMGDRVLDNTDARISQESCTQYNMLKLARTLFSWTGDPAYADHYERALLNGVMGVVRLPRDMWPEARPAAAAAAGPGGRRRLMASDSATAAGGHQHPHHGHSHDDHSGHHHPHHLHQGHHLRDLLEMLQDDSRIAGGNQARHPHPHGSGGHVASWQEAAGGSHPVLLGQQAADGAGRALLAAAGAAEAQSAAGAILKQRQLRQFHARSLKQGGVVASGLGLGLGGGLRAAGATVHRRRHYRQPGGGDEGGAYGVDVYGRASGGGPPLLGVHRRARYERWSGTFLAMRAPLPEWNVSDAPGPGVFLYLTHMGTGESKAENLHHWGFPFHSFWCCYGTIVESMAKLADSVFFKDMHSAGGAGAANAPAAAGFLPLPPRLYVNQLVACSLRWKEMGLGLDMEADMFAPGPAAVARLRVTASWRNITSFALMLRVPGWARARGARVSVNHQPWEQCPGPPRPGTYCQVTRAWRVGDVVHVHLPMRWWSSPLQDSRPGIVGRYAALMLGPFVMVGISHGSRQLHVAATNSTLLLDLPVAGAVGPDNSDSGDDGGSSGTPSDDGGGLPPGLHAYPPEGPDELMSLLAGWNSSLHIAHDSHHLYMEVLEDGGDMMDATFRIGRGCHHHHGHAHEASASSVAVALAGLARGGAASAAPRAAVNGTSAAGTVAAAAQSAFMRMGLHEAAHHVSLEAMGFPNHFVAADHDDVIMLQPGPNPLLQRAHEVAATADPCPHAAWMLQPGLDRRPGSVSLEAAHKPGWFLTAAAAAVPLRSDPACRDVLPEAACGGVNDTLCASQTFEARTLCRRSCTGGSCSALRGALRLAPQLVGDAAFAAASSFRIKPPARAAYPLGAQVLAALNRYALLVPLGHVVDERYTVYWEVTRR